MPTAWCNPFEKLGLRVIKKQKQDIQQVEVLNELYYDHEIIPCILEYRQLTKLKSTYVEGLIRSSTLRPEEYTRALIRLLQQPAVYQVRSPTFRISL